MPTKKTPAKIEIYKARFFDPYKTDEYPGRYAPVGVLIKSARGRGFIEVPLSGGHTIVNLPDADARNLRIALQKHRYDGTSQENHRNEALIVHCGRKSQTLAGLDTRYTSTVYAIPYDSATLKPIKEIEVPRIEEALQTCRKPNEPSIRLISSQRPEPEFKTNKKGLSKEQLRELKIGHIMKQLQKWRQK